MFDDKIFIRRRISLEFFFFGTKCNDISRLFLTQKKWKQLQYKPIKVEREFLNLEALSLSLKKKKLNLNLEKIMKLDDVVAWWVLLHVVHGTTSTDQSISGIRRKSEHTTSNHGRKLWSNEFWAASRIFHWKPQNSELNWLTSIWFEVIDFSSDFHRATILNFDSIFQVRHFQKPNQSKISLQFYVCHFCVSFSCHYMQNGGCHRHRHAFLPLYSHFICFKCSIGPFSVTT